MGVIDEAWEKAKDPVANGVEIIQQSGGRKKYIPMNRRIGWEGGALGSGDDLKYLEIVIEAGTENQVVTAFPSKG